MPYLSFPERPRAKDLQIEQIAEASHLPISLEEVKASLLISHTGDDALITSLIQAAANQIRGLTNRSLMQETWRQTQSHVPDGYMLVREPVLAILAVEYIPTETGTSWTTLDPANYVLAGKRVLQLAYAWPGHRSVAGWRTTFTAGFKSLPDNPTSEDIAASRAAIPSPIRQAIIQLVGHLLENREGQGPDLKYEALARDYKALPPNVALLLEPYRYWRLT